jgi:hypothetical protein
VVKNILPVTMQNGSNVEWMPGVSTLKCRPE